MEGGCLVDRRLGRAQIFQRIDSGGALAQLEMKLWRIDGTGLSSLGNHIAAANRVTALHIELPVVGIGRNPAAVMTNEHEIAIAFEFIACVGDNAALGCAKINLQLHVHNEAGVRFWEALGYAVEPRISMGKNTF